MPALTNALNDPVPKVRIFACMALGMVGPDWNPAIHALKSASEQDPDKNVQAEAASELTRIDFESKFKARTP
jgi:HEAT repeat protein